MIRKKPSSFPLLRILFVFLALVLPSLGDGKIYIPLEKIPTSIPYQRAIILHSSGKQQLILQSQYQLPSEAEPSQLGWVVPVPAPPEVASIPADSADRLFFKCNFRTFPSQTRWGDMITFWLFILMLALIPVLAVLVCLPRFAALRYLLPFSIFTCLITVLLISLFGTAGASLNGGKEDVEILQSHRAGIYDVTVLRSESSSALLNWLTENSFNFDKQDEAAIQSHINRGWCFVAAKVRPDTDLSDSSAVTKTLLAPLVLSFPSATPVYPTALTATGDHDTEILLYLLSETPLSTKSPIQLRYREKQELAPMISELDELDIQPLSFFDFRIPHNPSLNRLNHIHKYKGTLTPGRANNFL
ncbi:MAG: DUF2330 domain-containing protein [Verrucomicrobiota bacterium JB025]|nr:DUF2330 domain-containing protein [Verrucomicrobiota bacterium JB025]